jgi:superoxide dismutase, Cu-Zn family
MSWGYYRGDLKDYTTTPDVFEGASATAIMIAVDGSSFFRLRVTGIDGDALGNTYPVHLHKSECVAGNPGAAEGHYNDDEENGATEWDVTNKNEVWLTFTVNSEGNARSTARVEFVPKPDERSIVIHSDEAGAPRLACLPFKIKSYSR